MRLETFFEESNQGLKIWYADVIAQTGKQRETPTEKETEAFFWGAPKN